MSKYLSKLKELFFSFAFFSSVVVFVLFWTSIYYFNTSSKSIENLLVTAPDSNLSLLVGTLKTFGFDSIIISFAISSFIVSIIIIFQYLRFVYLIEEKITFKYTKREFIYKTITEIVKLFVLLFVTTFSFIILMAATKPENSSFALNFLPYIGSILLFGYGILFRDKKESYKVKDKS